MYMMFRSATYHLVDSADPHWGVDRICRFCYTGCLRCSFPGKNRVMVNEAKSGIPPTQFLQEAVYSVGRFVHSLDRVWSSSSRKYTGDGYRFYICEHRFQFSNIGLFWPIGNSELGRRTPVFKARIYQNQVNLRSNEGVQWKFAPRFRHKFPWILICTSRETCIYISAHLQQVGNQTLWIYIKNALNRWDIRSNRSLFSFIFLWYLYGIYYVHPILRGDI